MGKYISKHEFSKELINESHSAYMIPQIIVQAIPTQIFLFFSPPF